MARIIRIGTGTMSVRQEDIRVGDIIISGGTSVTPFTEGKTAAELEGIERGMSIGEPSERRRGGGSAQQLSWTEKRQLVREAEARAKQEQIRRGREEAKRQVEERQAERRRIEQERQTQITQRRLREAKKEFVLTAETVERQRGLKGKLQSIEDK